MPWKDPEVAKQKNAIRQRRYNDTPKGAANRKAADLRSREKKREFIKSVKLTAGCVDCGYNEYACALEFDHLPGTVKLFAVGQVSAHGWPAFIVEMMKCEVVCSNCHHVRTEIRRLKEKEEEPWR